MTHDDDAFRAAFSAFLEGSGRWRDTEPETLLARWSNFVDACERGYRDDAQDYFNDLTSRDSLERAMNAAELQGFAELSEFRARVEDVDAKFRPLLLPDAFPRINERSWWVRGVVRYGGRRLAEDLSHQYGVFITEVA
ncbi:hypothetical protein [Melissospora conviva]|uniref:hypothetical protein n=1 Tax=Melissospora conviva TaxID=3388432 RepID=UPI003B771EA4